MEMVPPSPSRSPYRSAVMAFTLFALVAVVFAQVEDAHVSHLREFCICQVILGRYDLHFRNVKLPVLRIVDNDEFFHFFFGCTASIKLS